MDFEVSLDQIKFSPLDLHYRKWCAFPSTATSEECLMCHYDNEKDNLILSLKGRRSKNSFFYRNHDYAENKPLLWLIKKYQLQFNNHKNMIYYRIKISVCFSFVTSNITTGINNDSYFVPLNDKAFRF